MAWFKVDDNFHTSRKVLSIPRRHRLAAVGLWTMAGNWSARELTDGRVPTYVLEELGATETLIRALVDARLWLDHRSTEARPTADHASTGIEFHNWAKYQPTREDVRAERAKAAERQRKWRERQASETRESPVSNAVTNTVTNGVSNGAPTRPVPTHPQRVSTSEADASDQETVRDDVKALCKHLSKNLTANDVKHTVGKGWHDAARLLLDRDGRNPQEAHRLIDWATTDSFWRTNILSMPKFREKYDQLRLKAQEKGATIHPLRPPADPEPGTEAWNRLYQPWMFQ